MFSKNTDNLTSAQSALDEMHATITSALEELKMYRRARQTWIKALETPRNFDDAGARWDMLLSAPETFTSDEVNQLLQAVMRNKFNYCHGDISAILIKFFKTTVHTHTGTHSTWMVVYRFSRYPRSKNEHQWNATWTPFQKFIEETLLDAKQIA